MCHHHLVNLASSKLAHFVLFKTNFPFTLLTYYFLYNVIEQYVLDTYAGKQLSWAAIYVQLTMVLKKEQHLNLDVNF